MIFGKIFVNKSQKAPSKWRDHPNNLCNVYLWIILSAINCMPLIIIINAIRPALVFPKYVKTVRNHSEISPNTSSLRRLLLSKLKKRQYFNFFLGTFNYFLPLQRASSKRCILICGTLFCLPVTNLFKIATRFNSWDLKLNNKPLKS